MEELEVMERPGFFARLFGGKSHREFEEYNSSDHRNGDTNSSILSPSSLFNVRIRKHIITFDDALSTADGLKQGEQQILNLTSTDPNLREKIKDFLSGVVYAEKATWEEIGENIYLLSPQGVIVTSTPNTPRMSATHN
jgi:cell division inhibitor SepF